MKKTAFWILLVLLVCGLCELMATAGLKYLKHAKRIDYQATTVIQDHQKTIIRNLVSGESRYIGFDTDLGWRIHAGGSSGLYRANTSGLRADREYAADPPDGILRIGAFGDSFTHGNDVANPDTWQSVMERTRNGLEILNFGVPAYGLDQAYLRYLKDGRRFRLHLVWIGYMGENICRNVNVYRPFYFARTDFPLTKPRFVAENDGLRLLPNPMQHLQDYNMLLVNPEQTLRKLGKNDYFFQRSSGLGKGWPRTVQLSYFLAREVSHKISGNNIFVADRYNTDSEAFDVTLRIFDQFVRDVQRDRARPIILLFPGREDLSCYRKGKGKRYQPLLSALDKRGYACIDLMEAVGHTSIKRLFADHSHYTPLGNRLVAGYLLDQLERNRLVWVDR